MKIGSIACATLVAVSLAVPANAATRNFGITSFDRIRVDGPYRVTLATGVPPFARASGSNSAIDRVSIDVQGRTLIVRANPSWGGYPGRESGTIDIQLGTHDLEWATLNGSGSLAIDRVKGLDFVLSVQGSGLATIGQVSTDNLRVALAGTASAAVAGKTGKLSTAVRGLSSLDAGKLIAKTADVSADGPATIEVHVVDTAKIAASGVATVTLAGRPSCNNVLTGSASVSGCR